MAVPVFSGRFSACLRYVREQAGDAGVEGVRQWVPADAARVFASLDNGAHMVCVEVGLSHLIGQGAFHGRLPVAQVQALARCRKHGLGNAGVGAQRLAQRRAFGGLQFVALGGVEICSLQVQGRLGGIHMGVA